jgi:hypothetical protein
MIAVFCTRYFFCCEKDKKYAQYSRDNGKLEPVKMYRIITEADPRSYQDSARSALFYYKAPDRLNN